MEINANPRLLRRTASLLVPGDQRPRPPDETEALIAKIVEAGMSLVFRAVTEDEPIELDGLAWARVVTVDPEGAGRPAKIMVAGLDAPAGPFGPLRPLGFALDVHPRGSEAEVVGAGLHRLGQLPPTASERSWIYTEDKEIDLGDGPEPAELLGWLLPTVSGTLGMTVARPIGSSRWVARPSLTPPLGKAAFDARGCLGEPDAPRFFDTEQEAFDALVAVLPSRPSGAAYPDSRLHLSARQ